MNVSRSKLVATATATAMTMTVAKGVAKHVLCFGA